MDYVFGNNGSDDAHKYSDGRFMSVGHFFILDYVGSKDIYDQNDNEYECFDMESLCTH